MESHKVGAFLSENNELIQNLKKKRPNLICLDIERLFQESVELTEMHRKLADENEKLKKDLHKVEQAKMQRQQFISQVERIVKEKSKELAGKTSHQSSWLVLKLQQKIFTLKQEIEAKQKAIRKLNLSKENQVLFKKQIEVQCLKQINQFAEEIGLFSESQSYNNNENEDLEEIVWMDDYLQTEKQRIQELENQLEQEERETKRLLTAIGVKKAEIKRIKEIEKEYMTVQQNIIQEKRKKQQKTVDNKGFLTNLMKERDQQIDKLQNLKKKRTEIQAQQVAAIKKLEEKLNFLTKFYEENKGNVVSVKHKSDNQIQVQSKEQWVKRVAVRQVEPITKNLRHSLALRNVDQEKWVSELFKDQKSTYSIENMIHKLGSYPFLMKNERQKTLLGRYVVQDNNTGLMLEDMNTSQDAPIIKSILIKLIGQVKVYTAERIAQLREQLGNKLNKYWSLVEQSVHIKQGVKNQISREILIQGINDAELQFTEEELNFTVLYLFSWSGDLSKLELNKLGKLKQLGLNIHEVKHKQN